MRLLQVRVDVDKALAEVKDLKDNQLPFTIARTLTKTAQDAQAASRDLARGVFTLRNDWTVRNIKIKPATKQTMVATIYTDTENRASGAGDYLPAQQDSAEKVPLMGRMHLAIPTKYLRQMVGENKPIPDWLRPKAVMAYADNAGKYMSTRGRSKGSIRSSPTTIRGLVFFLAQLKSGAYAIMARQVTEREAYPMYVLVTRAHIRKRFPMEATVEQIVNRVFAENFKRFAAETMMNDLLRGSGISYKI